jgi:hypothetical protein
VTGTPTQDSDVVTAIVTAGKLTVTVDPVAVIVGPTTVTVDVLV